MWPSGLGACLCCKAIGAVPCRVSWVRISKFPKENSNTNGINTKKYKKSLFIPLSFPPYPSNQLISEYVMPRGKKNTSRQNHNALYPVRCRCRKKRCPRPTSRCRCPWMSPWRKRTPGCLSYPSTPASHGEVRNIKAPSDSLLLQHTA
jgi:hypothetical protein